MAKESIDIIRHENHVQEKLSLALVEALLPDEWIVRKIPNDYGVDLEVEVVMNRKVTGKRVWLQVKSKKKSKPLSISYRFGGDDSLSERTVTDEFISYSYKTRYIKYAQVCPFPLLLVVVDLDKKDAYWAPVNDFVIHSLNKESKDWELQGSSTIRVPLRNSLNWERTNGYPGLKWYAQEPSRMYAFAKLTELYYALRERIDSESAGLGIAEKFQVAHDVSRAILDLSPLFGDEGIQFFNQIIEYPFTTYYPPKFRIERAAEMAGMTLRALQEGSSKPEDAQYALDLVLETLEGASRLARVYQGFKANFLVTRGGALRRELQKEGRASNVDHVPMKEALVYF